MIPKTAAAEGQGLVVSGLSFGYQKSEPILSGLSFSLKPGELMLISGVNGAGKSTLINILAGLLKPLSGSLSLNGEAESLRGQSALVPQNIEHWLLAETGREDIFLGLDPNDLPTRARFAEINERWQLEPFLDKPLETLSLGQKKRVALASALLKNKPLMLFDELMAGLDWPGQQTMLDDLAKIKQQAQTIMIMVSHDPQPLAPLTNHYLFLKPDARYQFSPTPPSFSAFGVRPFYTNCF